MNSEFDDAIKGVKVERTRDKFVIHQLRIEKFYWSADEMEIGMPISTSIELISDYNFENEKLEWKKLITHTFYSDGVDSKYSFNSYEEDIDNPDELLKEIEKYDLRDLKNNYYTEEEPECFSRWELTYNYHFKIVGTYDQNIDEFNKICDLLDFKKVIDDELKKVKDHYGE